MGYELKHEEPLPFEIVKVASIVPHPGYLPGSSAHDVAILYLEHDVHLDRHVGTICLQDQSQQSYIPQGAKCISTGWGKHILQGNFICCNHLSFFSNNNKLCVVNFSSLGGSDNALGASRRNRGKRMPATDFKRRGAD